MKANSFPLRNAKVKVFGIIALLVVALGVNACAADCQTCRNETTNQTVEVCDESEIDSYENLGMTCQ